MCTSSAGAGAGERKELCALRFSGAIMSARSRPADARRRDPAALRRQAMCGNGNCDSGGETRAMKGEDGFSGGADGTQAINV